MRQLSLLTTPLPHPDLPKAARVYATLRDAIVAMRLRPGARLVEKDLCEELEVSRTPLRDAILRLAQERLVTVVPSDATFVNKIIFDDVIEGHFLRESVELRMVTLACRRFGPEFLSGFEFVMFREVDAARNHDHNASFDLDNEFHHLICNCAGFPKIWDTIHRVTGQLERVRRNAFPMEGLHLEIIDEHRALVEAIRCGEEGTAVTLLKDHLAGNLHSLRILLDRAPEQVAFDTASPAYQLLAQMELPGRTETVAPNVVPDTARPGGEDRTDTVFVDGPRSAGGRTRGRSLGSPMSHGRPPDGAKGGAADDQHSVRKARTKARLLDPTPSA